MAFTCHSCGASFVNLEALNSHTPLCNTGARFSVWSFEKVDKLLTLMEDRYRALVNTYPRQKGPFWIKIDRELGVGADQARIKWNALVQSYRRIKEKASKRPKGARKCSRWDHFATMDRILAYNPRMTSKRLIRSRGGAGALEPPYDQDSVTDSDDSVSRDNQVFESRTPCDPVADGIVWPVEKVESFLKIMVNQYRVLVNTLPGQKRIDFWLNIAQELGVSADDARIKWNLLCQTYKRLKDQAARTGGDALNHWDHFEAMERIIGQNLDASSTRFILSNQSAPNRPDLWRGSDQTAQARPDRKQGENVDMSSYFAQRIEIERQRLSLDERQCEIDERRIAMVEKSVAMEERRLELLSQLLSIMAKKKNSSNLGTLIPQLL
ncbi:uncharacterized protein LOC119108526 [Pollicipes pollicipes]|uniref:uncharacterized protein LOC119108526 n=1 Tax=Pollicipes pollicipes TaxID=41117 RepID=UPI0018850967|nr:uncharacterized protein LOC119108526 [Pollicipes pollicipes]XP_037087999.1 uncharacterized protein LOC119108526 [Pollicipes pollicipes]XP_037088000.1 uncharacterized protein LOC119108526 [Pollicipes pollicipes]XP_037088001.1 uncharacterized protein LOC119108526 [Pollicipes pollicipes]XP_037088002.1 uncharacterized protein LOC119108526 [Pollicipes pollicipes]XP_037088003.1 uncharacterized protein LOC119108526 [Pollicipes pollicipes]XP_037088004.1 uncharacterized protein LOC119108526 [Pollic